MRKRITYIDTMITRETANEVKGKTMNLKPLHEVRDENKLQSIATSMTASGWVGRPVLALDCGDYVQAFTGSHRIAAAQIAGIEPEVVVIEQALVTGDNDDVVALFELLLDGDDNDRRDSLAKLADMGLVDQSAAEIMESEDDD